MDYAFKNPFRSRKMKQGLDPGFSFSVSKEFSDPYRAASLNNFRNLSYINTIISNIRRACTKIMK